MSFDGVLKQLLGVQQRIDSLQDRVNNTTTPAPNPFGEGYVVEYNNVNLVGGTTNVTFSNEFNIPPFVLISPIDTDLTDTIVSIANVMYDSFDIVAVDTAGQPPVGGSVAYMAIGRPADNPGQ